MSHNLVQNKDVCNNRLFFPLDLNSYKWIDCLSCNGYIDFSTSLNDVNLEDEVYLYATRPYSAIVGKFKIKQILSNDEAIDDSNFIRNGKKVKDKKYYVRLQLVEEYMHKKDLLELEILQMHGLKTMRSQHRISNELKAYLDTI